MIELKGGKLLGFCEVCNNSKIIFTGHDHPIQVCEECFNSIYKTCESCGDEVHVDKAYSEGDHYLCLVCHIKRLH